MLPTTMKALVTVGDGSFQLKEVVVPGPGADQILVKVVAAAQNPTDWKTLLLHTQSGNILGCDFAGTIVQIGTDVPAGLRKLGERVAGVVHGGIGPNGAYAEYVVADAALVIALPDDMTFENAAQLGVAGLTTCQCLYQCLRLPTPLAPAPVPDDILIWSGTSATGQYAVQFAKVAGLRVISTASPGNIDFVKSLGADEVFDYVDSKTPKRIAAAAGGTLKYAVDCISEGMTPNQVSVSLGKDGGTIATLLPYKSRRKGVDTVFILAYSALGKAVEFPFPFPQNSEHHENAKMYCKLISEVLSKHTIKHVPVRLYPNGLASVELGFEDMKAGKVHAEKITYRISDTPGLRE
ncbi:chaperonin 10-like protein [Mycena albidolilacea]|uniref:Chaperonin 10-like protein n=1 Tax=Mycena albidolilacea TaxID=1033008 RepID=A0AAD7ABU3_9AGAR|nr:chaperonin 10-like protein [Mycena albidolilacea]